MNILLIADIHSNLPALESVFNFIQMKNIKPDKIFILGDIVGYGPFPNECLEWIKKLKTDFIVAGNHEWAVLNKLDINKFNFNAREAILFTRKVLTKENHEFISQLGESISYKLENVDYLAVHGSPRDQIMEYILNGIIAKVNIDYSRGNVTFFAHTHVPFIYYKEEKKVYEIMITGQMSVKIDLNFKYLINPGSIGQPRDHNPMASFCILDTVNQEYNFYRVPYNIEHMMKYMDKFDLPVFLSKRLLYGI
ncbi:MAG: metallophosphoesterase family protein [bacterium]|nr:metallophosphoesterase family protein [bacterium]